MSSNDLARIKNACGLIKAGKERGTGYLVSSELMITCEHVVKLVEKGDSVTVLFEYVQYGATLFEHVQYGATVEDKNADTDCALLKLEKPITVEPLRISLGDYNRNDKWISYGFPKIANESGHLLAGRVQDLNNKDPKGKDAVVLCPDEIAAGSDAQPQDFCGAPVLIGSFVIGHLKGIIPDHRDLSLKGGSIRTLYASPARAILEILPKEFIGADKTKPKPAVGYDRNLYIPRGDEEVAMGFLDHPGAPVVIYGYKRFGKTAMLKHLLDRIRRDDPQHNIATITIGPIASQTKSSLDSLLKEMATLLIKDISKKPGEDWTGEGWTEKVWQSSGDPLAKMNELTDVGTHFVSL